MKHSIRLLVLLVFIAFGLPAMSQEVAHNEELKALYKADQTDRQSGNIDWQKVSERDAQRQARVYELLEENQVQTSKDYANAAMIFQHGHDTIASGMAVKMMRKAIELDPTANKWLLAAAIDRDLMRKNKPQIYGTQYRRMGANDPWEIYNLDPTVISDEERKAYGVRTLAQQQERLRQMNKKKLSEMLGNGKSVSEIIKFCESENLVESEYDLSENGINSFGYQLMAQGKDKAALQVFELNTKLYPEGFNTYDSLGECLLKLGQQEAGVKAYKKSLELNPKNKNAETVLAELGKKE
ncbi:MAG: hypothetical protein KTR30_38465 [Saprospiraceae bacterium]|nr:hypothetical protein [Saprospiraceae bacterium]